MKILISIALSLLFPVATFAAEKSVPSAPKEIISAAQAEGARQVIRQLFESNVWQTHVYPGISSGDSQWLEVAKTLRPATDAGASEEMDDALSLALLKRPYAVLPVLKRLWWEKSADICHFGWDSEFPDMTVRSYINQLEQALGKASSKKNAELRKLCLKGINKTRKELLENKQ
jgi:hypothetical protein